MSYEITTDIKSTLVVVPPGIVAEIADIRAAADAVQAVDSAESFATADAVCSRVVAIDRQIETARTAAKKPLLDLGRQIDEIAAELRVPIIGAKQRIGALLMRYQQLENLRRDEERRRIEVENRRREEEAAEAARMRAQVSDGWDELAEPAEAPADVVHVPELMPAPAPLKSKAVFSRKVRDIVIDDADKIPDHLEMGGTKIPLWIVDEKAVKKLALQLADHGATIPGVRVVELDAVSAKGK